MSGPVAAVGIDLELDGQGRLFAVGARLGDAEFRRTVHGEPTAALRELDDFAAAADVVVGHNVHWHDLPWLAQHAPELRLLRKPALDTLALSAIAFAEHPYHALVKDYKLVRDARNDPAADARLALRLLADARQRLRDLSRAAPAFGRVVRALGPLGMAAIRPAAAAGMALLADDLGPARDERARDHANDRTSEPAGDAHSDLAADLRTLLADRACATGLATTTAAAGREPATALALLFAVAWLRVAATPDAASPSVVMPWVRRQLPQASELVRTLRDVPCRDAGCDWCRRVHDPLAQLRRWFRHDDFRAQPALPDGRPAQRAIVDAGFADQPLLALLPTGGGKSLCFQLPAIQRYLRRGALTVIVSPLQSLMHDQVDNFRAKTGAHFAYALTGRLTPPERRATLDAVRTGQAGLLYVSPEQLRNATFAKAIALREIGGWVFDEAHCLSKWGHDFRPDYLYAARFVREFRARHAAPPAPVTCVTATAKPEVRDEILRHFRDELGQDLQVFDGHAPRTNLTLRVEPMPSHHKVQRLRELVADQLVAGPRGSVLVYTATRGNAEKAANLLQIAGIEAEAFHAGLDVPQKKAVQERFLAGERRVVCATNAFGMGIDKPDIRLVVHFEIPGSLEAYVQEVGRAGRDGQPATAVLLATDDDVETQFRLAATSRLSAKDVQGILRRIRGLARPVRDGDEREAVCTTGEILQDDELADRLPTSDRGAPTRVLTAIAWLERRGFLRRDGNATAVFQGRPLVTDLREAEARIAGLSLPAAKAAAWLAVLARLTDADADEGLSSDDFLGMPALVGVVGAQPGAAGGRAVLGMLIEMQKARLLSSGTLMTAFVRHGVAEPSTARLQAAARLETALVDLLREEAPDLDGSQPCPLRLQAVAHALAGRGHEATMDAVQAIVAAMADRALHAAERTPGLRVQFTARDQCLARLHGSWEVAVASCRRRHAIAQVCLDAMLARLPDEHGRGAAVLVEFALEQLVQAIDQDLELRSQPSPDPAAEIEYALLFLHRVGAIVLHKGLAVFRQAMALRVPERAAGRKFTREDFRPLAEHQDQRTTQIHVMHEFAQRMAQDPAAGLRLLDDYFRLPAERFLDACFGARRGELARATGTASWQRIVAGLSKDQRRIVEADEDESMLVLAGPGSGKTRVVVHRCAWLLRVARVPARAILVLCFNRSAALELRRRLRDLVGDDARGVLIQTYHGMAARLAGRSPADALEQGASADEAFRAILQTAIDLLGGGRADPAKGTAADTGGDDVRDDVRDRLLAGFRHILVDEYQDIDEAQYQLVSAIAGRTLRDEDRRLAVLAVGDDDQNIYQWRGSKLEFLRRFETDYRARRLPLVENYRSTAHIVAAANAVIAPNRERLKRDHALRVDGDRAAAPAGGRFAALDPDGGGRVRVVAIAAVDDQPAAVLAELRRLAALDAGFAFADCAVLAPRHALLDAVRAALSAAGVPVRRRVDGSQAYSLFRLREVQAFLAAVEAEAGAAVDGPRLRDVAAALRAARPRERHHDLVAQTLRQYADEFGEHAQPAHTVREFFGDVLQEQRREQSIGDGVLLGTVHGSKGAEHDHVLLLDGGWQLRDHDDLDALRRLYYVGMTRARQTLTLLHCPADGAPWLRTLQGPATVRAAGPRAATAAPALRYELLGHGDLWLAFAGRDEQHDAIAAAIDGLCSGDALRLVAARGRLCLATVDGALVGALSREASTRWLAALPTVAEVRVAAILTRRRSDETPDYRELLRRDRWHVVIPEITSCRAAAHRAP